MNRRTTVLALAFALAASCAPPPGASIEANKDLVRQAEAALNDADWEALDSLLTDDFSRHSAASPEPPVRSRADYVAQQKAFLEPWPDQRLTTERMVAEGDFVAVQARFTGTQTGPMAGFPATGKAVDIPFFGLFRIENGRIAELWVEWDNVVMLTQLGLFPPPDPQG